MKAFKKWPKWHKVWVLAILAGFWISGAVTAYRIGNDANQATDGTSEQLSLYAAYHYLDHGFFEHYGLPTWPPFGFGPDGKRRSEPFVYTHYLAGADVVNALWMKVFGRDALWAVRLIPQTFTVLALGFLTLQFAAFTGSTFLGALLLGFLMIPKALTKWSYCLFGHSYVMAWYLLIAGVLFWMVNNRNKNAKFAWGFGLATGLHQMAFDLDWVPLTFVATASLVCMLVPKLDFKQGKRILIGMFIGGCIAAAYQVTISSIYYGSLSHTIKDLVMWGSFRAGVDVFHHGALNDGAMGLRRLLQEYNRQAYGATGFTAMNLLTLCLVFVTLGYLGGVLREKKELYRVLGTIALGALASCIWNIGMQGHSAAHTHFIPRHYFVLYLTLMFVALPISRELVLRARAAGAGYSKKGAVTA